MDDLISRQAAVDMLMERASNLRGTVGDLGGACSGAAKLIAQFPSAEPKRGRWIYHIDDLFPAESTMECNQCHAEQPLTCDDEFCPHCGSDMRGEQNG